MEYIFSGIVYNVVDGDTVDAELDLGFKLKIKQRLRLAGIDTPERGQPGFEEAKQALIEKTLNKTLTFTTYKQSKWGYFLADIEFDDQSINQSMITEGFAKPYTGGTKDDTSS
jgi:micrococcal nuclease